MTSEHGRGEWFRPGDLDENQRALYDSITTGPRAQNRAGSLVDEEGRLEGPFNSMLHSPVVGDILQQLGAAIRYRTGLEGRARELATLEVARVARSDFEWNAHASAGRNAGLSDEEIAAILAGDDIATLSPYEQAVRGLVQELLATADLDDADFATYSEALGHPTVMDLICLVGYYNLLAMSMRVWRVPLAEGMSAVF